MKHQTSEGVNLSRESLVPMSFFLPKLSELFLKLDFTIVTFNTKHKVPFPYCGYWDFGSNHPIKIEIGFPGARSASASNST